MGSGYNSFFFPLDKNTCIGAICQNVLDGATVPASVPIIVIASQPFGPGILNRCRNSKFFIEETTCREMFAQLIASSCNSAVSGAVHPSFPEIIKQLSPLDARFLLLFKKQSTFPIVELTEKDTNGKLTPYPNLLFDFMAVPNDFTYPEHLELSKTVDMLIRFGLLIKNDRIIQLNYDYDSFKKHWFYSAMEKTLEEGSTLKIHSYRIQLTLLGKDFVKSCVPDDTGE